MIKALISQREVVNQYGGLSDSLEKEYVEFFSEIGITLFPVSNFGNIEATLLMDWDFTILSGGGILPQRYYNYEKYGTQQEYRDAIEEKLIKNGIEKDIPILGICRGRQITNAFFGGKISNFEYCAVERKVRKSHPVVING